MPPLVIIWFGFLSFSMWSGTVSCASVYVEYLSTRESGFQFHGNGYRPGPIPRPTEHLILGIRFYGDGLWSSTGHERVEWVRTILGGQEGEDRTPQSLLPPLLLGVVSTSLPPGHSRSSNRVGQRG